MLLQEEGFRETLDQLPLGLARIAYACTHTTFAPTVVHGGTKTNVIPDRVDIEVDIRTLPGQSGEHAHKMLLDAIGDLADKVEIESVTPPSRSEIDTPLCFVEDGEQFHSPAHLQLKFESFGGAKIDTDSVRLTYLKTPNVDLTPRIKSFVQASGIDIPDVELPVGEHMLRVDVKDSDGRTGTTSILLKVAP